MLGRMRRPVLLWLFCLILAPAPASSADSLDASMSTDGWLADALNDVSADRMLKDIAALSGVDFVGRQTGSPQDLTSAAFVADRFAQLRMHRTPAPPPQHHTNPLPFREWKQTAPVTFRTIEDHPQLLVETPASPSPLTPGRDFLPILDSPSADLAASIVFVGHGVSEHDYEGIDVRGKIVLFLRGKPEKYNGPAAHSDKERLAKRKGAAGYLTATGPILTPYEQRRGVTPSPSAFYSTVDPVSQLPGAWVSTDVADAIVRAGSGGNKTLLALQAETQRNGASAAFDTGVTARMAWTSPIREGTLCNVASIIRGYAAATDDALVIGAHRDHFGRQAGLLFAGADDNASGTAVLLEVARVMAQAPAAPKRSIVFVSFSGEEQGLLGSRLYVSQPIVPLSKTVTMINVDHAGVGNGRLTVGVTGMEQSAAMEAGLMAGLADRLDLFGFFPGGDHVPFKEAGVPTVTVVSGGVHPHFHQSTDTVETLNPEILQSIARYVLTLAWRLADAP